MTLQTTEIERLIHDIHHFFTEWVGGRCAADPETFRAGALDRISDELVAIFPAGGKFGKADFERYMTGLHGSNPDFRIAIRNISVTQTSDDLAVVNYEEWQRNAKQSEEPNNGRITTMIIGARPHGDGIEIRHVHETWLPREVVADGDFNF